MFNYKRKGVRFEMEQLGVLIKALLDPDSTKNIESQIKNLQDLFDKSPLRIKIDIDNAEFKTLSANLEKLSTKINESLNITTNNSGLDKVAITMNTTKKDMEFMEKKVKEYVNTQGQLIRETSRYRQEVDAEGNAYTVLAKRTEEIVSKYKQLRQEQERLAEAMAKGRERAEAQRKALDRKFELEQAKAINKALDEQYIKSQKALKQQAETYQKLSFELQKLKNNAEATNNIIKNFGGKEYHIRADEITASLNKLNISQDMTQKEMQETIIQAKLLSNELTNVARQAKATGNNSMTLASMLKTAWDKMAVWSVVTVSWFGIIRTIKNGIEVINELDTSLTELNKTADLTSSQLRNVTERAYELGSTIGRTGKEVIDALAEFSKAGYNIEQSFGLAEAAIVMTNVAEGINSVEEATSSLIAALKGYQMDASQAMRVVDMLNQVSNTTASNFDDLADGLRRTSGTLAQTGTSIEELLGLLVGGFEPLRNIEMVSSGLNMISQRLRGIGEDGEVIEGLMPKLQKDFMDIAKISIIDPETGGLRSTYDILKDMAKVFPTLTDQQRQYLGELAAGNRQVKVLNAILNNWESVEKAVENAKNSTGSALRENEKYLNSIQGKISQFTSAVQQMWYHTISSDIIKFFVDLGTGIIRLVDKIGLLNTTFAVLWAYLSLTGKFKLVTIFDGWAMAAGRLAIALTGSSAAASALATAISTFAPIAAIASIYGLIKLIDKLHTSVTEASESILQGFNKLKVTYSELNELANEYEQLAKKEEKNIEDKQRLLDIQMQINSQYAVGQKNLDLYTAAIEGNTDAINSNVEAIRNRAKEIAEQYVNLHKYEYEIAKKFLESQYTDPIFERSGYIKIYENPTKALEAYGKAMQEAAEKGNEFAYQQYKNVYKKLLEQIEAANQAIAIFEGYSNIIEENKNIIEEAGNKNNEYKQSVEAINNAIDKISDDVKQYSSNIRTLSSIYQTLADDQKLTADTFLELISLYPQYASQIVKMNDSKENAINLTKTLFKLEKERYIAILKQEAELLKSKINILQAEMAIGQWYVYYYSKGVSGGTEEFRKAHEELTSLEETIKYLKDLTIDDFTKPSKSSSKSYTPKSRLEALKELLDVEKISLQEYYNELIKIEQSAYKDYENKSVAQLEALLTSTNEKTAKKAEEALDLRKEINRVRAELFKETEYDKAITALDNELDKLGNINTPEELARQAEILGQKFVLAQQEVSRLEEQLKDPSLTESLRKLLEDKKIKIEIDIVKFKDQAEQLLRDYYEIEREISEKSLQSRFDKQLAYYEKQIYDGLTKDAWEEASNIRIQSYEEEIKRLREQNDLIEERIKREKYLADIEKQRTIVANLQKERTVRVYREGEGWVWEADQKKLKDATEKLANLEEEYYNWEAQLKRERRIRELQENIEHERQMQEEKRKSYEQQKRLLDEQLQYEKLELEKHYLDMDALVAEGLDEIKGTYEEKWDEILTVLQDRLSRARQIMKEIEELNIKAQQAALSVNVVTPTINSSSANVYDSGGRFPSGALGINLSGKDEMVLSPTQTKAWVKLSDHLINLSKMFDRIQSFKMPSLMPAVAGGGIIENHYHFDNLNVTTPDAQTFIKVLPTLVKQYKNR